VLGFPPFPLFIVWLDAAVVAQADDCREISFVIQRRRTKHTFESRAVFAAINPFVRLIPSASFGVSPTTRVSAMAAFSGGLQPKAQAHLAQQAQAQAYSAQ
jgi:hypothetical protein